MKMLDTFTQAIAGLRLYAFLILVCGTILTGCGGGFQDDNENAEEFMNGIFKPDEIDTSSVR